MNAPTPAIAITYAHAARRFDRGLPTVVATLRGANDPATFPEEVAYLTERYMPKTFGEILRSKRRAVRSRVGAHAELALFIPARKATR